MNQDQFKTLFQRIKDAEEEKEKAFEKYDNEINKAKAEIADFVLEQWPIGTKVRTATKGIGIIVGVEVTYTSYAGHRVGLALKKVKKDGTPSKMDLYRYGGWGFNEVERV